jgi:peptide/nickel transport system permease protein
VRATGPSPNRVAAPRSNGGLRSKAARRFLANRNGVIGGIVVLLLLFTAMFGPSLTPYDPLRVNPRQSLQPPSLEHPAGTDRLGRDILSRIVHGSRISLQMGFIAVSIALVAGGALGLLSGYVGGRLDDAVSFLVNTLLALPGILLALVIIAAIGPGLQNVMLAVGISAVPTFARVVRANTLAVKERAFVEASRALGVSDVAIVLRHILPNILPPLIVLSTLGVATAILAGASVSYLGLGAQPPMPEWGSMVNEGRTHLRTGWWLSTMPGLAIMVTVLGLNLFGDGLRDLLDPRLDATSGKGGTRR